MLTITKGKTQKQIEDFELKLENEKKQHLENVILDLSLASASKNILYFI